MLKWCYFLILLLFQWQNLIRIFTKAFGLSDVEYSVDGNTHIQGIRKREHKNVSEVLYLLEGYCCHTANNVWLKYKLLSFLFKE